MAETEQANVDYADLIKAQTREVDLDSFRERGMRKVNVINAKRINELIAQAVTNIITRMEDADVETIKEDKAQIVVDSMAEFKRLVADQKNEQEQQHKLHEEIEHLREELARALTAVPSAPAAAGSTVTSDAVLEAVKDLKAFLMSQASKTQADQMSRAMLAEQQQNMLEDHFGQLKELLAGNQPADAPASEAVSGSISELTTRTTEAQQAVQTALDNIAQLLKQQGESRSADTQKALQEAVAQFSKLLKEQGEARSKETQQAVQGIVEQISALLKQQAESRDGGTQKALEAATARITSLLEQSENSRGSATNESMLKALTELRGDLTGKVNQLADTVRNTTADRAGQDAQALKAEIAALREDLAQKTMAAGMAGAEALQAQLNHMQELLAKGGGGLGGGDMNELVSKLEGSMSRKLSDAGLMKQEVSAEDAVSAGSVMVNSAFRNLDSVEANLGAMDDRKQKDKDGGKKAKGALDALKKLKGK